MKLVHDKEMFDKFVNTVLPPLNDGEVYFVSLSARNKYLTPEEREHYSLGRAEMFSRTLCYGDWDYVMAKMAASLEYKTTKNGLPFPEHALVVYVNVNPSNMVKASMNFAKTVMRVSSELLTGYMGEKDTQPNLKSLDKADRLLMNEIQKATGTRHYLDVDVDAPEEVAVVLREFLMFHGVLFHEVKTHGGTHFLVNRVSLNESKAELHRVVAEQHRLVKCSGKGEVVFNDNQMVSMPGTLHGGKLVRLV